MRQQSGITLVELMVGLALACLIATGSSGTFGTLADQSGFIATSNNFISHFRYARSAAVTLHQRVTVCKSADAQYCTLSNGWDQGWIIFVDLNTDGVRAENEEILRVTAEQKGIIAGSALVQDYVSFDTTGNLRQVSGDLQIGQIVLCSSLEKASESRYVDLAPSGRIQAVAKPPADTSMCL